MQRFTLLMCSRCRRFPFHSAVQDQWFSSSQCMSRRFRSTESGRPRRQRSAVDSDRTRGRNVAHKSQTRPSSYPKAEHLSVGRSISVSEVPEFFQGQAEEWVKQRHVHRRLANYGIPAKDIRPLLHTFLTDIHAGQLTSSPETVRKYGLARFADSSTETQEHLDRIFTNIFYRWATDCSREDYLQSVVPYSTIYDMQRLTRAVDFRHPADVHRLARSVRRKVILHVGPTNSGKTHNALRALAAADIGVYAGPLRLLAHEIWERMNKGQIVPAGVDADADTDPVPETNLDVEIGGRKGIRKSNGNPKYIRPCNLLTGEEQKIVDLSAPLISATVEMVSFNTYWDVGVIDEIQMIADPDRGFAWTDAVLGLCAKELHLCGEETAVPLIEELMKHTGEELIVHRYQRLSPLVVENESLGGDLGRVRKGDAVVAFSRSGIYALKAKVEELTGLRCAIAYGRLPPETRSEQAALFNDPDSGYDVLVGTDSIGMGLNLKIKRIIFETVRKFDGQNERYLSNSQMKQIAGRAGRFGLHDNDPGGLVTTLYQNDLPILRKALAAPSEPLRHARLGVSGSTLAGIFQALPTGSTTCTVFEVPHYVATLDNPFKFRDTPQLRRMTDFIDTRAGTMTLAEKHLLMQAPIPWRDMACMDVVDVFLRMHRTHLSVDVHRSLFGTNYVQTVKGVEQLIAAGRAPQASSQTLQELETFHKVLGLYMWLSFKNPVTYADYDAVYELKGRVEKVLDWCLQGVQNVGALGYVDNRAKRQKDVHWETKWQKQTAKAQEAAQRETSTRHYTYVKVPSQHADAT